MQELKRVPLHAPTAVDLFQLDPTTIVVLEVELPVLIVDIEPVSVALAA